MRCETCHGSGHLEMPELKIDGCEQLPLALPCPECNGAGDVSCCDGLQEMDSPQLAFQYDNSPVANGRRMRKVKSSG